MNIASSEQFAVWSDRLNKSDEKAFAELFEHSYDFMFAYITKYIFCRDSARDVLQDVYIKVWNIRESLDSDKSLKALMYQMVRNSALNHLRDRKDKNISLDSVGEYEHQTEPEIFDLYDKQEANTLHNQIQDWINELPERQREAFELSRYEGMSHQEIAEVMDLKPRTVNNHIVLALNNLRKRLDDYRAKSVVI
ncbi:MAG: RNA polymerase sigma-70 factor [Balneolales bacterium]|nr:RNA polymerase sigma-70 factor [Balneolales bacterium]